MDNHILSITEKKSNHFYGVAKISLQTLDFGVALKQQHREESEKTRKRLLHVFRYEGCQRLEEEHFIDALISRDCFESALQSAGLRRGSAQLKWPPDNGKENCITFLHPPGPVHCLNGLHRVEAAKEYLDNNDQWWVIRLYDEKGFEHGLTTKLCEAFSNEQSYSDGVIFRNILRYARQGNEEAEQKWKARLSPSKLKDLRQLLKCDQLSKAFQRLIDLPGLWPPIQLGTLHRLHGLRCSEELSQYLTYVRYTWDSIVPHEFRAQLDYQTVLHLETLVPARSAYDAKHIKHLMSRGDIFPSIIGEANRNRILRAVLGFDRLIPSLRTFFENQKYLEPCANIIKQLLDSTERRTLWRAMQANYYKPEGVIIDFPGGSMSLHSRSPTTQAATDEGLHMGYFQLWLFCLRHFPEMTSIAPRMEPKSKAVQRYHSPALWKQLGKLTVALGFKTQNALALAEEEIDYSQAEEFLRSARPGSKSEHIVDHIKEIVKVLERYDSKVSFQGVLPRPALSGEQYLPREKRHGRPFDGDHDHDKAFLFIPFFTHVEESRVKPEITTIYAKQDMLKAFFPETVAWVSKYRESEFNRIHKPLFEGESHGSLTNHSIMPLHHTTKKEAVWVTVDELQNKLQNIETTLQMTQNEVYNLRAANIELKDLRLNLQGAEVALRKKEQDITCLQTSNSELVELQQKSHAIVLTLQVKEKELVDLQTINAQLEEHNYNLQEEVDHNLIVGTVDTYHDTLQHDDYERMAESTRQTSCKLNQTEEKLRAMEESYKTCMSQCKSLETEKERMAEQLNVIVEHMSIMPSSHQFSGDDTGRLAVSVMEALQSSLESLQNENSRIQKDLEDTEKLQSEAKEATAQLHDLSEYVDTMPVQKEASLMQTVQKAIEFYEGNAKSCIEKTQNNQLALQNVTSDTKDDMRHKPSYHRLQGYSRVKFNRRERIGFELLFQKQIASTRRSDVRLIFDLVTSHSNTLRVFVMQFAEGFRVIELDIHNDKPTITAFMDLMRPVGLKFDEGRCPEGSMNGYIFSPDGAFKIMKDAYDAQQFVTMLQRSRTLIFSTEQDIRMFSDELNNRKRRKYDWTEDATRGTKSHRVDTGDLDMETM